jgi:D-glycero-D-manno-heptose 1,7-bisphosphate phosphatase
MGNDERRYILLDRDGVINRDLPGSVCRVADFDPLPGALEAIVELNRKGYRVLVLTNQSCVGRGELDPPELQAIHRLMRKLVVDAGGRIDGIYVCPHTEEDGCDCRKPRPGLIEQARSAHGFDPATTWLVGDASRDIAAARSAGCRPALVRTGKGASSAAHTEASMFDDLAQFARELRDDRQEP